VHYGGYDEPRLTHFSRVLADRGFAVVTPEIDGLKNYEIQPSAVDAIERSALWLLDASGLVTEEEGQKIGLLGISFSGGLCLSAGSRQSLKGRLAYVFAFGSHANLDRTLNYLTTGELPGEANLPPHIYGANLPPHIYGQAVLARWFAEKLVPPDQVDSLRKVLLVYLHEKFEEAKKASETLGPESQHLVKLCLERNTKDLGRILLPHVQTLASPDCLSPEKNKPPDCPLFLLHGSTDNVIPAYETHQLKAWAEPRTETVTLVSHLIQHVELGEEGADFSLIDYWDILRFWTRMLK
jgi:hypothetical protein